MTEAAPTRDLSQVTPLPLYKETNFQESPIGKIPLDWVATKVVEIGEVVSGFGFSLDFQGKKSGKYPFVKVGDMNSTSKYVSTAENYVDEEELKALKAKAFPPNTLIFPKIGMAIYLNKYRLLKVWATFDNNVAGIIPKRVDSEFLYYYFKGFVDLKQSSSRTTAPSIRKTTLESLIMPLPEVAEQRAIVGVLGVVDCAIELADRIIAQTERLKRGLMQQLLTRGIGHTETKQTPIGNIPKTWQVVALGDFGSVKTGPFGSQLTKGQLTKDGFKVYEQENVLHSDFSRGKDYINQEKFNSLRSFQILPGDILLTRVGSLGNAAEVPRTILPGIIGSRLLRIRISSSELHPTYLKNALDSPLLQQQLEQTAHGATRKGLNSSIVKRLKIPLPPIEEQSRINKTLLTVEEKLRLEIMEKARLERIKRGLMDLLLTGKIRITVD